MMRKTSIKIRQWGIRVGRGMDCVHGAAGFTLTEMMIVVAIIALIAGIIVPSVTSRFEKAKINLTKTQIRQIGVGLEQFRLDCGFYPSTEQGLQALIEKPVSGRGCANFDPEGYLGKTKAPPKDPFDSENKRELDYTSDGRTYLIRSYGPDGKPDAEGGTQDDITSDNVSS